MSVPYIPQATSSAEYASSFPAQRIVHVSASSGTTEYVHLFATPAVASTEDVIITVEVIPHTELTTPAGGTSMVATRWPMPDRGISFTVRGTQSAPQQILQGFGIHSGAALSVYTRSSGLLMYGFVVVAQDA